MPKGLLLAPREPWDVMRYGHTTRPRPPDTILAAGAAEPGCMGRPGGSQPLSRMLPSSTLQVYNLTPYLKFHPGGVAILMSVAGKDGTALFNK